jgi:CDP-diacylglycerol--serine O-phosphatidyltransferase
LINGSQNIVVGPEDIKVFSSAKSYKQQLLSLIEQAKQRIYITALYVQDDEAGREILHALYQAKNNNPSLDVKVFVDFHRAQRGLIGEKEQLGNRALYLALTKQYQHSIDIYGVAVKGKELFGVLHLKGMVFDDTVFYTGASINDVYLHQQERYRLDRYYQIKSTELSQVFCTYLDEAFVDSTLAPKLNLEALPEPKDQRKNIKQLKSLVTKSHFLPLKRKKMFENSTAVKDKITATPMIGCGRRHNELNRAIRQLVQNSEQSLVLFTPYFNLPKVLTRDVIRALKRGVKISITVGDKTANDFYIADEQAFSTIGIIPYVYEMLLMRFVKRWQKYIDQGQLEIRLWKDKSNSFHLKGIIADQRFHLLTGSNLNPRAWSLDLENGILLDDPQGLLLPDFENELAAIYQHTRVVKNYNALERINDYPDRPKRLLKKIQMTQIDKVLQRFL